MENDIFPSSLSHFYSRLRPFCSSYLIGSSADRTLSTPLTCGGQSDDVALVAGPADVDRPHRDEVAASSLQLDQTLTGGHGHHRPAGWSHHGTRGRQHSGVLYAQ